MTLSTNRFSLASIALIAAALLLSACHSDSVAHNDTLAASPKEASSWDTLPQSDTLRAAEQTYRACAREAAQLHIATKEFPQISDRVTYLTQDGRRVRKTEQMSVNVDDMHIDNGCATRIVYSISVDVIPEGATPAIVEQTSPDVSAHVQLAIDRKTPAAPACALTRDPGPQSHFMMLNLCRSEEHRAEQEQQARQEEPIVRPKKNISPATSS
ncbi:hypothetical protein [Herbaspirillum rhizosphaerae]|uniref:hypothetical protein n=1 Tax=Herbaspirillum rhizosphaerae TaxID=346179 RepID=UPI00067E4350|nr:hypothetical protein [Herbaspirillum rhizosphaerae]